MGSKSSKLAKSAATAASTTPRRQYPKRIPQLDSSPSPSAHPPSPPPPPPPPSQPSHTPAATAEKSPSIIADASDPHFAASLRSLGVVTPASTLSNSSTAAHNTSTNQAPARSFPAFPDPRQNITLRVLEARDQIQADAEAEMAMGRETGKRYLDIATLKRAVQLKSDGKMTPEQIEKGLGLRSGTVDRLKGVGVAAGDEA